MKKEYTSLEDSRQEIAEYINQSTKRVQKRLREIWRKNEQKVTRRISSDKEKIYV